MAISKILHMKDSGNSFHARHLKRALDYVMNPEKTQRGRLVGAINCQADMAFEQMMDTKKQFGKTDKRQGYHIILSFKEDEVEPDRAFEITQKFVAEYLGDAYEAHSGNKKKVSIYGQEYTNTTFKLAKMNLAIRGISANLGEMAANTFTNDQHKDLKADFIMANPPFNQKQWRAENELVDDPRWNGYEVPPTSNANYGWILNIVSKLSQNGVAGFLLANGALSDDGTELKIRQQLIENHLVEAIIILPRNLFYTTDISVTLWVLNKNKKARVVEQNGKLKRYRDREDEILFMDLRQMGSPYEKKYIELTEEDRAKVTSVYHNWQQEGYEETYENVPEFCYSASFDEVKEKGFTLVPSRYIEFVNRDENIDFDTKMKSLQGELKELLVQEEKSKSDLLAVFKELGYEIEL